MTALSNERMINEQFTTIALPDASAIRRYAVNRTEGMNIEEVESPWGTVRRDDKTWSSLVFDDLMADRMVDEILNNIASMVYQSGAVHMDPRRYFGAWSPDVTALRRLSTTGGDLPGSGGQTAAFVAQCRGVTRHFNFGGGYRDEETGVWRRQLITYTRVIFDIEEVVWIHPDVRNHPRQVFIQMFIHDANGEHFYTAGERYLIAGALYDSGFLSNGSWRSMHSLIVTPPETTRIITAGAITSYDEISESEWMDAVWRITSDLPTPDEFPIDITAFSVTQEEAGHFPFALGQMTLEEALRSPMGEAIADVLLATEKNSNRLNMVTTGNLESFFMFNQHRAHIEEGRGFTRQEYGDGARVAVVPRVLAANNDLTVGDTITLQFFEGEFKSVTYTSTTSMSSSDGSVVITDRSSFRSWQPGGFVSGVQESEFYEFEIIGIYFAPPARIENDPQGIPLNTIFIPDKAFAGFEPVMTDGELRMWGDDRAESPFLNTIVVPNGRIEEFRRNINALIPGYGNFFMFYDQGYSTVRSALDNLLRNGWFIFVLCFAGWCIAALVFCLFFILRKRKETDLLYALGVRRKDRFRWVFVQCVIVIVLAQGIAYVVSDRFYEQILDYAVERTFVAEEDEATPFADAAVIADGISYEAEIQQQPMTIPLATGAVSIALLMMAGGMAKSVAKREKR